MIRDPAPIDPAQAYVVLDADGTSQVVPGGAAFWAQTEAQIERFGHGWLVSVFDCTEDWPNWEMHPQGDELVLVLAGEVEFLFDRAGELQSQRVTDGGLVVVPRGVWHTARVRRPARLLHVTMGAGTQHRAVAG